MADAPDPIALAAEARRLLRLGAEHVPSPLAQRIFALVPALADAVNALVAEREAWQRATGCADPLTISEALARVGRILGKTPTEGIPDAADRVLAERDAARAEATSHFRELLAAQREKNAALSRAEDAAAESDRLAAELVEARAETARAVAAEREACATVVDSVPDGDDVSLDGLAAAIRARGGA